MSNNSKTVQHRAIFTMADLEKVVSNGAIFNDLKGPLPPVLRSRHSLTLNILGYRHNLMEY